MTNSEKAAYIRGLMEGMDLDPNAKETKLFNAIVDLLDDLSLSVEEMEDAYDELSGQVDEIDEDLGELEEEFYDIDEDEDDYDDDAWEDDEDECYYEVTCPKCGDTIELNEEMLDEGAPSIARTAAKRWSSTSKKTIPAIAAKTATAIRNNFRVI